jgi:DNA-directed RNA polymerase subunit RPC12/RpoP
LAISDEFSLPTALVSAILTFHKSWQSNLRSATILLGKSRTATKFHARSIGAYHHKSIAMRQHAPIDRNSLCRLTHLLSPDLMSSWYSIVCESCQSFRTERIKASMTWFEYRCLACGIVFGFKDHQEYVDKHPPNMSKCPKCDELSVELVERNHRYDGQADKEETDLYRCAKCDLELLIMTKRDPGVLYD